MIESIGTEAFSVNSGPMKRIPPETLVGVFNRALDGGLVGAQDTAVVFYDMSRLAQTLRILKQAFPSHTCHTIAAKANPLLEVLKGIRSGGCGLEVASMGEIHLALAAGFEAKMIVFDSPVKTRDEVNFALAEGIGINANSIEELNRISQATPLSNSSSRIGIRINPEIGSGSIDSTSVAVVNSKFGVPLSTQRDHLLKIISECRWLSGIHVHIGSQGMSQDQLVSGINRVYEFFLESNILGQLLTFNIGGGLPAQYREADAPVWFSGYADALRTECPRLFGPEVTLVTEFGRSIHANSSWVATRIEYIRSDDADSSTIYVHVGADMFLRVAYRPSDWHHDLTVCSSTGQLRTGTCKLYRVAGPLCFAGDYLERRVFLPDNIAEGDYILIHDSGAYTYSMWSLYNSRQFPSVLGYEMGDSSFRYLKRRQAIEDIVDFWSK